ncbi:MAG TPA: PIN domain-containing protein [Phycisphaerae bacterium]|nr:PIN domain-containing protein [Phycisphaerae bacterium]HOJ74473.1 PIN domain-containing protein [Phycisphaerae bacterium]HOM53330.1 PIN domain-containing protein [Phycisphaerae bacterium]HON68867.1 PIN domain-containing protein [Phycisphaerae bacterium]HOQ87105.1 PIN domain-containing protein [Phycisphaerae bacterium]
MKYTFVDTSWLLALLVSSDELHEKALRLQLLLRPPVLTTEYVLVEFADALSKRARDVVSRTLKYLREDPDTRIVQCSNALFEKGLELFENRPDKPWSLTDCNSFITMREHGATDALTWDHHLEQAGFRALLRSPVAGA